jgi:threonine/homoserine/homoserine lactone efflux protein
VLWSFILVVGLLTLTPGLDTALILRTAALGAPRRAWGVVLGIQGGTLVWGVLTSAGVTALLTASHVAYEVLRWAGAAYLIWLGLGMLRHARRPTSAAPSAATAAAAGPAAGAAASTSGAAAADASASAADAVAKNDFFPGFRRGALTNLLNPKMGVFYVALLPQFIPSGAPTFGYGVLLACIHIMLGTVWSAVLVLLARRLRGVLQRPRARQVLDRITGTVIAGFGVRLATSSH